MKAVWRIFIQMHPDMNRRIIQRAYITKIEEMFKRNTSLAKPDVVSYSDYALLFEKLLKSFEKGYTY